jgi:hypothetical protein
MVSTRQPSQAEQVASNAQARADGGFIFADAPNADTSAAVIVHQISMHRNITPLRVTRLSRVSSRASGGFTTIVQSNSSPARSFPLLTRIRWINQRPDRPERCLQTGKRCFTMNEDQNIRAALDRHWAASDANDFEAEHEIYHDDAVLEYPQSGERIRGRRNIQASRTAQPNKKRFSVRRILGAADLWVTEFILTYDGLPSYTVSIMEFKDDKVARETQYFGDPFEPGASRAQWVERMR